MLGLAQAQAGHMLAILIGGKTPCLLERILGIADHFYLVGEWYVEIIIVPTRTKDGTLTSIATWTAW